MYFKPRILLVDDDTTALDLMCEILSEKDYEVDTSSYVDEAVEKLKSQHYHALITDLKMPSKSGIELLEHVVSTYPDIPVIMLTAYGTIQSAVEALKKGAFDYVCKPFTPEELEVVVQKALERCMLQQAADEAEREKERFILTIYHQLKSPVGIIEAYLKNLLKGVPAGEAERIGILHRCLKRAETLRQLLEDLLSLNRLQSGKLDLNMEPVKLDEVLGECVESYKVGAQERNVHLHADVSSSLPPVRGNREQLGHLFGNLIDNAIRYTGDGGAVEVKAVPDHSEVRAHVSDTGMGISTKDMPRIFDEFYRCQSEQSRSIPGTGLGLSIVKTIAETHAGRIDVQSELGKGTTFSVWLPLWK